MRMPYNKGKGKAVAWLRAHARYTGDCCLIFPFSRNIETGYGTFGLDGEVLYAHRFMCELVNGPSPSTRHYATHSCGMGHGGCVHPQHLAWKTPSQNSEEMVAQGNGRKRGTPRRKLTAEQVATIKKLKGNCTQSTLAIMFNVSNSTIAEIHRGRAHKGPARPNTPIPSHK